MAKSYKITADDLEASVRQHKPQALGAFGSLKPKLGKLVAQKELSAFLGVAVEVRAEERFLLYAWKKGDAAYEMQVPRNGPAVPAESSKAEPPAEPDEHAAQAAAPESEVQTAALTPSRDPSPAAPNVLRDTPSRGIFAALEQLVGKDTLMMSFCKVNSHLQVTVSGFDETFQPICLTGSADELEAGLPSVLGGRGAALKAFTDQVEALKEADKALEEAKKEEAQAKRKKATKARDNAKAAKEKAEEKAEDPKPRETDVPNLFEAA